MESYQKNTKMCKTNRSKIEELPLAMAYVPWQHWSDLYAPEKGLQVGTIFQELHFPFIGRGGFRR